MSDRPHGSLVREVDRVLVVGSGLMGSGIAQVAAQAGLTVTLVDTAEAALEGARARIDDSLTRLVRSEKLSKVGADEARRLITTTVDLESSAHDADLVVEAIIEDLDPKQALFEQLDGWCPADVVLSTNTSQYQIHRVAAHCVHPERVIGMHWSNPPPLMLLVEIVLADATSTAVLDATRTFLDRCGRESVVCRKDVPGFISNRLSTVLFMEAVRLVDEGVAVPEDIDAVARLMYGHRMGPLATLDLAGLDTALRVSTALAEHYGGDRFTPAPTLHDLVSRGRFGRKTGSGFYEHNT